jgi:putative heme-binding domain-containing protein
LEALAATGFEHDGDLRTLLNAYPSFPGRLRARCQEIVLSRKEWARAFLQAVDAGGIPATNVPANALRLVASHRDPGLDELVRRHWGRISVGTPEEKLAEIRRLNNDLRAAPGNSARGHPLFVRLCATCHSLLGEGGQIGPDLTHANRADRDYLLASLIDPSAVVRKEHMAYEVETTDGRVFTGLLAERADGRVVMTSATGEQTVLARGDLKQTRESTVSLMPEGLLQTLSPQELRDLFAWLQGDGK